ncbi:hypothetical protein CALVIDRAFT_539050 [Calocera viscosa TUFC12733]|uniref:Pex19-domain-containing protein n=1 Tax=Calocera viscosa (strain TUFC12733) TaxID=1330018 RepID=A0A167K603_CALVF|nr:hypothetical protein CALVIDRAFT_539050 [Calocera viscosa TUFC12733]
MPLPVAGPARPPASQSPAPVVAKAAPEKPVQSPPTSATVVTASLPASTPSNPTTTTAAATTASTSSPHPVAGPPPPPTYQSALNATLSRLQSSSASASLPSPGAGDPFADLLAGAGAGAGGEEGMQGVLEGLMRSLLSREVLEEPLNELAERYPKYLTEHPDLSLKEKETYTAQLAAVRNMLAIFTAKGYEDGDPEWSVRVVEGMNKLQELGTPPKEVMGELPDLAALGGGLPGTDGCVVA